MRTIHQISYQVKCTGYSKDGVSFPTERTVEYIVGEQYRILRNKTVTLESIVKAEGGFEVRFSDDYILFVPLSKGLEYIYKGLKPENLNTNGDQ